MVKGKLPPQSGARVEAVEPHPQKAAIKFFFIVKNKAYSSLSLILAAQWNYAGLLVRPPTFHFVNCHFSIIRTRHIMQGILIIHFKHKPIEHFQKIYYR